MPETPLRAVVELERRPADGLAVCVKTLPRSMCPRLSDVNSYAHVIVRRPVTRVARPRNSVVAGRCFRSGQRLMEPLWSPAGATGGKRSQIALRG